MLITSSLFELFYHSYKVSSAEFWILKIMLPSSRTLRSSVKFNKSDEKLENKNKVPIAVRKHDRNKISETTLTVQNTRENKASLKIPIIKVTDVDTEHNDKSSYEPITNTRKRSINNVKPETTSEENFDTNETAKKSQRKMIVTVNIKIKPEDQKNVILLNDEQTQMIRKRTSKNVNLKGDEISSNYVKIKASKMKSMESDTKSAERMCQKIIPGKNIKIESNLDDAFTVAKALVKEKPIKRDTVKMKDKSGNINVRMCGTVKDEVADLNSFQSIDRISSSESLFSAPKSVGKPPRKSLNNDIKEEMHVDNVKNIEQITDIEDAAWQPHNWKEIWENILKMRKMYIAPVDSLGCEECPDKNTPPEVFRYQTLISVMLSSQTRDEVTYAATQRLIEHGLTIENILMTPDKKIGELIYPAGFWKSKVQYIKRTSQILKDYYKGDIPRTFKELCLLPGVGPKMANIVMSVGWNDTVGIAVDVHVHRISNRLGWVRKPTKQPEQTRKALESWLPKDLWKDASFHLVGFGQTICKPVKPKCHQCLNAVLCPVGRQTMRPGKAM